MARLLDRKGESWITMTPLNGLDWSYDTSSTLRNAGRTSSSSARSACGKNARLGRRGTSKTRKSAGSRSRSPIRSSAVSRFTGNTRIRPAGLQGLGSQDPHPVESSSALRERGRDDVPALRLLRRVRHREMLRLRTVRRGLPVERGDVRRVFWEDGGRSATTAGGSRTC